MTLYFRLRLHPNGLAQWWVVEQEGPMQRLWHPKKPDLENVIKALQAASDISDCINDLLDHLEEFVAQYGCDCGHPACNGCERTRAAREVINKAKGVTG